MLDGQVGKNLVIMFGRVAAFGHHGGDEQLRSGDSVRGRVDEPLLDARPLPRVACPRRIGQRLDVKIRDSVLALGQFGFRLAPAVALTHHIVAGGTGPAVASRYLAVLLVTFQLSPEPRRRKEPETANVITQTDY